MATTGKRRTQTSSKSTGKTNTRKKGGRKKADPIETFTNEVILLIVLALAIILMVSNFGIGGFVGNAVSSFFFGLFGLPSYIFPFMLFIGVAFFMSNKRNPLAYKKLIAGLFFYVFLCALMQLLTEGYLNTATLFEFYQSSARYHTGGGIVGSAICKVCATAFGVIGAYVLIFLGLIISLIFMTQRSFLGFFKKLFSAVGGGVSSYKAKREEERPLREAKAAERAQRAALRAKEREMRKAASQGGEEGGFLAGTKLMPSQPPVEEKNRKSKKAEQKTETPEPEIQEQVDFQIQRSDSYSEEEEIEIPMPSVKVQETDKLPFEEAKLPEEEPEIKAQRDAEKEEAKKKPSSVRKKTSSKQEIASNVENIKQEIEVQPKKAEYQFPPLSLLKKGKKGAGGDSDEHLRETAMKLQTTLHNFGVNVTVTNVSCGPTVTRYELQPEQGVKVSKIVSLTDDIKLNLATADIRIEAPIPGKAAVGIEVPNKENSAVMLRDLLQSQEFQQAKSKLAFAAGKDIGGKPVVADIGKMPHVLIAGATGSGKSVCINTLIMSILYKASPEEVKLIMVDPKVVELSVYNGIPHLLIPVVTDPKKAAGALNWAVAEMTDRYNTFAEYGVRNLEDYNNKLDHMTFQEGEKIPEKMPQIVIIVDELADLMMVAPGEVEDAICRLAQLARAAGIHLVIATQRPSVNVITGLIKANMPSRIAFAVSSGVDSRTILDMNGAEKLLGKGDMLFYPQGYQKPARLQGAYVSDQEVSAVVDFLSNKNPTSSYNEEIEQKINTSGFSHGAASGGADERDTYFIDAGKFIIEKDKASIGMLQRAFKIGFNRAARIMDQLSSAGVVGPEEGTKPRKVLMAMEEFENYIEENL